jgi:hypothetical protein
MCLVVGYLVAFTVHQANGVSHIAAGQPAIRQAHVWLGYVTLAGVVLQVLVGLYKYIVKTRDNARTATWHGKLGPLVWLVGIVTICAFVIFVVLAFCLLASAGIPSFCGGLRCVVVASPRPQLRSDRLARPRRPIAEPLLALAHDTLVPLQAWASESSGR